MYVTKFIYLIVFGLDWYNVFHLNAIESFDFFFGGGGEGG